MELSQNPNILSITDLNQLSKQVLESQLSGVWVQGEISNLTCPRSGHLYFTLKDSGAQVRCVMFRFQAAKLSAPPQEGMAVQAKAKVTLYEPRGDYQLQVEQMVLGSEGLLRQKLKALMTQLKADGLFDKACKQPLPKAPLHIGVVTSPTGAAIQDILKVLKQRYPIAQITVFPCLVQGASAPHSIIEALLKADDFGVDVIILGRGGGSLEDLWAFNDENLAQVIFNAQTPIVSAVGHEVDISISDYVADATAPTPSAAAALVTPDLSNIRTQLQQLVERLLYAMDQQMQQKSQDIRALHARLHDPRKTLAANSALLSQLTARLLQSIEPVLYSSEQSVKTLTCRLPVAMQRQLVNAEHQVTHYPKQLSQAIEGCLQQKQSQIEGLGHALQALSPLSVLSRGYAMTLTASHPAKAITSQSAIKVGEQIKVQWHDGSHLAQIVADDS